MNVESVSKSAEIVAESLMGIGEHRDDPVSAPSHYGGDACRRAEAEMMGPDAHIVPNGSDHALSPLGIHWWGAAFEYLWRWPHKGGVDDLRKCIQDLEFLIAEVDS